MATTTSWSFSDRSNELTTLRTDFDARSRRLDSVVIISNVGTVAMRNAMLMNAPSGSFAAALQDQNVTKLYVGYVAAAVIAALFSPMTLRNGSSASEHFEI